MIFQAGSQNRNSVRMNKNYKVVILLSVYNGEKYLNEQLDSILSQTHENWTLYWRDDGSTDSSLAIMQFFSSHKGRGKCVEISSSSLQLGVSNSYFELMKNTSEGDFFAFADQDDLWLPKKLEWALEHLCKFPKEKHSFYCARQYLTDKNKNIYCESFRISSIEKSFFFGVNSEYCYRKHGCL